MKRWEQFARTPVPIAALLEWSPDPMLVADPDGRIVAVNSSLAALAGYEPEELAGRSVDDLVPSAWRQEHRAAREVEAAGTAAERMSMDGRDLALAGRDGEEIAVDVRLSPVVVDDRSYLVVAVRDVSAQRAAERERDRRAAMVAAQAEIRMDVLADQPLDETFESICRHARALLEGDMAMISTGTDDGEHMMVAAVAGGPDTPALVGATFAITGSIGEAVFVHRRPTMYDVATDPRVLLRGRPGMPSEGFGLSVPMQYGSVCMGVLAVIRRSGPYAADDIAVAVNFATQAVGALEYRRLRLDRERMMLMEERERIARDLHDSVIQDLFAAGLLLDAVLALESQSPAAERVETAIRVLDTSIKQLRSTIFLMGGFDPNVPVSALVRHVAAARATSLGFDPEVTLTGRSELLPNATVAELLQVVNEALANVARHAGASHVQVRLDVGEGGRTWSLAVEDDGCGFAVDLVPAGNGLRNLRSRAQLLGATLTLDSEPGRGTTVRVAVPGR